MPMFSYFLGSIDSFPVWHSLAGFERSLEVQSIAALLAAFVIFFVVRYRLR